MGSEQIFVFVVCGARQHVETLHYSLFALKKFSKKKILIVTDSSRNEIPVQHTDIIDVSTPPSLNHHQASIWLKTSLHKHLPRGPLYCYLDSDVIAASRHCDDVFGHYTAPISFAADHCKMQDFSPYAVNCCCADLYKKQRNELEKAISSVIDSPVYPPDMDNPEIRQLFSVLNKIRENPVKNKAKLIRLAWAVLTGVCRIDEDIWLHRREREWIFEESGFSYPFLFGYRKEIRQKTGYHFSLLSMRWIRPDGKAGVPNSCNHLQEAIQNSLGILVQKKNYQHWNGGVFLFSTESETFLNTWHELTLKIFEDPQWKVRDQGSLIATAWKTGLQFQPMIPEEYNFIADYYKLSISGKPGEEELTIRKGEKLVKPALVHVYHNFGKTGWDVWDAIHETVKPQ